MALKVVGRHVLLFDDDSNASFVNSATALVEWNSLSIDRYDVRHLLSAPPPRVKRRVASPPQHPYSPSESELDHERYLDLPSTSPEHEQDLDDEAGPVNDGGFHTVPFSYGNTDESTEERNVDSESGFRPPFSLPESLLQILPPSEKVHQIIARTAMFVSKNGGQSEIILRVKQGGNPTFGFLMPHHHLHSYFRFLVDHPELLREENKTNSGLDQTSNVGGGGALSLLGSVYGSGEDKDGAIEDAPELKRNADEAIAAVNVTVPNGAEQIESSVNVVGKDETVYKHSFPSLKEKAPLIKRNQPISTVKARSSSGKKKEGDALGSLCPAADKSEGSTLPMMSKVELPVVEPPSDMKRVVDKIVEFILRNGKEFEAVLVEQDHKHGRFPFLLQSNLYYPYYLKVLHKAEESRLPGKGLAFEKHDSTGLGMEKKNNISKESASLYLESDIPDDSDRKAKFKMVLGKSKKDAQDEPSKRSEPNNGVTMDAAAAAAILQAATRGIRKPDLESLTKMCLSGNRQGPSSEGGQASSLGSLLSSWPQSSKQKLDQTGEASVSVSVPVANVIAKSAAVADASEADSSEASLSREQELKAERLKRAKMFASMIKSKAAPIKTELHCQSVEPTESGFSESGAEIVNLMGKETECSSVPYDVDTFDRNEKSEKKDFADDIERRSKRKYRSRSTRDEEEAEDEEEDEEKEKDHKHSKRKRKSHRSSHHSRDRKRRSSSKDRYSQHRHKHDSTADNEHRHSCRQHKHDSSSDDEHSHSRNRRKHDRSNDDEHWHRGRSHKHRKRSHSERELELEEGEIKSDQSKASGVDAVSREASVDLSKSCQDGRASSQPSNTDVVSDDLRAKIRAMLMATL